MGSELKVRSIADKILNRGMAFAHDLIMIPMAWLGAYLLRFNLESVPSGFWQAALSMLVIVWPLQALIFWQMGLYRGVWRFASLPDLVRIIKSVAIGTLLAIVIIFLAKDFQGVPRSVPLLYGMLLVMFVGVPRFVYRSLKDRVRHYRSANRVIIVGAGRAGELLVRDMLRDRGRNYLPVAFVDDDRRKRGTEIHGVRVMGDIASLEKICGRLAIDLIMLAIPSAGKEQMNRFVTAAEKAGLPFRTVPHLDDLMSGNVRIDQLREVRIDDLLGRDPVVLDWDAINKGLANKKILVTGGGGSIGSELCRQIAGLGAAELVILEQSEFALFQIERELRAKYPALKLYIHLVDIAEPDVVNRVFARYSPQVVFHAAAYKHVPLLERQVREAFRNNVLGTRNVARAADRWGAEEFVLISTDKAVNPANIMGATKRAAEIYCQNLNNYSATNFITVRFGNVLGSTGSVVPIFQEQIARGGPLTVTHPDMVRYFMTTPEACQLIMQASVIGAGGEIFVLDMGEPVRIAYLAEQMILLSGKVPGKDIEIKYTGLRPGEKLFEELFHQNEPLMPTSHDSIRLAQYRKIDWRKLNQSMDSAEKACAAYDCLRLHEILGELVPERLYTEMDCDLAELHLLETEWRKQMN